MLYPPSASVAVRHKTPTASRRSLIRTYSPLSSASVASFGARVAAGSKATFGNDRHSVKRLCASKKSPPPLSMPGHASITATNDSNDSANPPPPHNLPSSAAAAALNASVASFPDAPTTLRAPAMTFAESLFGNSLGLDSITASVHSSAAFRVTALPLNSNVAPT
eukprot:28624-Pelagococcus_subviridis.AAC.3